MKSAIATAHLRAGGGGANISNLNQGILSSLPILVPNLETQNQFVGSMRRLNEQVDSLKHAATSKLTDLADLRQSLLQKAFSESI
jgi:type I restriction enzyme S subunit